VLTDTDPRVRAQVNLHAVLGSLPRLAELAPDAQAFLAGLPRPVAVSFRGPAGLSMDLTFARDGITSGRTPRAVRALLVFRSAAHLNAVVDGTAGPIPAAGPAGLRFLLRVFTPLSDLLGSYLQPTPDRLADAGFTEINALLTLHVAATAIAIIGNEDRSGQFSVAQMPDGDVDIEVGDGLRYRLAVRGSSIRLDGDPTGPPRAALTFADLDVAGGVLTGRYSALACICDGRMAMRGMIPLVDNTSRILDRVSSYLGK